jgi:hypothetical protein
MALGINAWQLVSVTPPLPAFGDDSLDTFDSEYTFTWRKLPKKKKDEGVSYIVNTRELRAFAGQHAVERSLAPEAVRNLETQLRQSAPASMALRAEAAEPTSASAPAAWRPLQDGDAFRANELVRLRVTLNEPAWLYVLAKDNTGGTAVLYPATDGEPLSRGAASLIPAGEWIYPGSVPGIEGDGMGFNSADPPGTESFVVIATKKPSSELGLALAQFAREARTQPASSNGASDSGIALTSLTRLPTFYAPSSETSVPSGSIGNPSGSRELVHFSGVGTATVLTINLKRVPPAN